jgi:hypothetical protein
MVDSNEGLRRLIRQGGFALTAFSKKRRYADTPIHSSPDTRLCQSPITSHFSPMMALHTVGSALRADRRSFRRNDPETTLPTTFGCSSAALGETCSFRRIYG